MENGEHIHTRYIENSYGFIPQYYDGIKWRRWKKFFLFSLVFLKAGKNDGDEAEKSCQKFLDDFHADPKTQELFPKVSVYNYPEKKSGNI